MNKNTLPLIGGFLFAFSMTSQAEDLSLVFSPPPVSTIEFDEQGNYESNKVGFTVVTIESQDQTFNVNSVSAVTRSGDRNLGFAFNAQVGYMYDDDDVFDGLTTGGTLSIEKVMDQGTVISGGWMYDITTISAEFGGFTSTTSSFTTGLQFSAQHRVPLGAQGRIGFTPFVVYSVLSTESETVSGSFESTSSFDVSSTSFGFDFDFDGASLALMLQSSEQADVTVLNIGFDI